MRKLGYGEDYLYPHDFDGAVVEQSYLPDQLEGKTYYKPSDRGYEARIHEYLDRVRRMRRGGARFRRRSWPGKSAK